MKPVLICGGVGTKMWPASSPQLPKHFLPMIDGKSLFRLNYEILLKKFKPEDIWVATTESQVELARSQAPEIPLSNYSIEPELRNQGPGTCLAAANLFKQFPDEPFFLVQIDDLREPEENYLKMIDTCGRLALETGKYITGGMRPKFAIMGADFIVKGERVTTADDVGIFKVAKFVWRGTKEQGVELLKDENVLTHVNHTCMTPRAFLEMIKKYRMDWYGPLMNIINGADVATEFAKMPKGPLEEVTQLVHQNGESLVAEVPFEWIDFGTWESVDMYLKRTDQYQNPTKLVNIESNENFVRMSDENKPVALIGVSNLVVVDTPQGLLICKKDQSGRVGEVVKELESRT